MEEKCLRVAFRTCACNKLTDQRADECIHGGTTLIGGDIHDTVYGLECQYAGSVCKGRGLVAYIRIFDSRSKEHHGGNSCVDACLSMSTDVKSSNRMNEIVGVHVMLGISEMWKKTWSKVRFMEQITVPRRHLHLGHSN